jgi:cell fate (sporulation/competence/biofilm development) regulator YlbF (YheA/YmcA/DUF963 family)
MEMSMDRVMELARRLGREIRQHGRFARLVAAETAVRANDEAKELFRLLEEQSRKIAELQNANRPIEPGDKQKLQELREKAHANALLQEVARAEADYMEMMTRINQAVHGELYAAETDLTASG